MFVPEEAGDWKVEAWNCNPQPVEREVKNMTINFGPQHPAAHGVLRLVLELAGEVRPFFRSAYGGGFMRSVNFRWSYEPTLILDSCTEAQKN